MMVRFESKAGSGFSMFEKDAKHMLELMGHSGTIPSAIRGEDVAAVLHKFQNALQQASQQENATLKEEEEQEDNPRRIRLDQRAYPLQQLLEAAAKQKENVLWHYDNSPL